MENYLCIEGKRTDLTPEQVEQITKTVICSRVRLAEKEVGETFKIGKYEFVVLEQSEATTAVILKDLLKNSKFSDTDCDFKTSIVANELEAFSGEIAEIIGSDNIIPHTVDLTSNDGLKDYGETTQRMSLLTADLYRRYVETLDKFNPGEWWWLATPYSTPKHGYNEYVLCVSPSGDVYGSGYSSFNFGVRPFCILNSNIFVS